MLTAVPQPDNDTLLYTGTSQRDRGPRGRHGIKGTGRGLLSAPETELRWFLPQLWFLPLCKAAQMLLPSLRLRARSVTGPFPRLLWLAENKVSRMDESLLWAHIEPFKVYSSRTGRCISAMDAPSAP